MMKKHGRFAHAFCTFDDNQSIVPIDLVVQVSGEAQVSSSQQTSVSLINSAHITNSHFVRKDTTLLWNILTSAANNLNKIASV